MAAATVTLQGVLGNTLMTDTAVTNSVVAGHSGNTTIYHVEFDNTANSSVTYLKIYESGSVTLGTTQPSLIVKAAASTKEYLSLPTGLTNLNAMQYIATTTASNSAGSPAAPSTACKLTILHVPY